MQKAVRGALWQLEGEAIHIKTKKLEKTTPDSSMSMSMQIIYPQYALVIAQNLEAICLMSHYVTHCSCFPEKQLTHIMISYQWGVQQEVLQFMQRLRKAGYRIWIDVEQMSKVDSDAQP